MIGQLFSEIIDRSVLVCYCIIIVLFVRFLLRKVSRKYSYFLWMIVFLNLVLPFSLTGNYSLIPRQIVDFSVSEEDYKIPDFTDNIVVFSEAGAGLEKEEFPAAQKETKQQNSSVTDIDEAFSQRLALPESLWILGILVFSIYSFSKGFQLDRSLKKQRIKQPEDEKRIYLVSDLSSPILWGFFQPAIYLPEDLAEDERDYVIEHESCHRRRKDHLIKYILYAVTIVYWFHPFVWLAYYLCCLDMEISCDEMVLDGTKVNIRKSYAKSLLKYAAKQNGFLLKPLTFGEPSLRSRISHILQYKKRGFWISAAAMFLCVLVATGLLVHPSEEENIERTEEENIPAKTEDNENETVTPIQNNGGSVVSVNGTVYYLYGREIFTNGKLLYTTQISDEGIPFLYQYELDESGFGELFEGTIVSSSEDGRFLYYLAPGEQEEPGFWIYDTTTETTKKVYDNNSRYLGTDEEFVYTCQQQDGLWYLNSYQLFEDGRKLNFPGEPLDVSDIMNFTVTDSHLLFSAGAYEGSAGYFSGEFYSFDLASKALNHAHLTDSDQFEVFRDKIYYSKYDNQESEREPILCCTDLNLTDEQQVGEGFDFLTGVELQNKILLSKDGKIYTAQPDGSDPHSIFDISLHGWEWSVYDKIRFTEVNIIDGLLFAKAEQWGYQEGNGWRDSLLKEEYYQISLDGSKSMVWDPDLEASDNYDYFSDPIPGNYCEDPESEGWDLTNIRDVRASFDQMSYAPERGTENDTYLLGTTDRYELYGKGDFQSMLLKCDENYAQISHPYASNYMMLPEIMESDFDGDSDTELAIRLEVKHGTGLYIETFLLADKNEFGKLTVYQFIDNDFIEQMSEHLSYQATQQGIQAYVDGVKAGPLMEHLQDMEAFSDVTVGAQMSFLFDHDSDNIFLCGDLQFVMEHNPGLFWENGYMIRAKVDWDGQHFSLNSFSPQASQ